MQPLIGEFLGTFLLIILGNGVVANVVLAKTKGHDAGWIVVTLEWGMAVFVAVWCVDALSGAHINPAVTVGLAAAGKFAWADAGGYIAAQMIGAIAGAACVFVFYQPHYAATDDKDAILDTFATRPAIAAPWNSFFCEAMGTAVLVLAVLMAGKPSVVATPAPADAPEITVGLGALGALPVGLLVLAIGLSLGGTTGYAINPARDLGPRFAHTLLPIPNKGGGNWGYAWIPVVGPLVGALLAAAIATGIERLDAV